MAYFVSLSFSVLAGLSELYFTKMSLCIIVVIAGFMRVFSIILHLDFHCATLGLTLMMQGLWDMPGLLYR